MVPTREQAWILLGEHTQNPNLVKHALGVEAAMRGYAQRFEEDRELWGIVGLLHDFDYEEHPSLDEHPFVGARILRELGYPEEIVHAILGHSDHTGVERVSRLDRALYAVDELVGFIVAVALVRPSKSVVDLPVKSIMKKFKDKAFCRAIDRDHLRTGAAELGVDMKEHVACVIESLRSVAPELGLE
ncbi:MAG TPA: HD domain-containing protein [Acidobacteriota bacterium]|nr:HD domain-containing protein [Acidobacteriota bacterium]